MRLRLYACLLGALALLAAVALSARPPRPGRGASGTMVLALEKPERCPVDPEVTVVLKAVLADSRCPENVLCVRAGGVRLELAARRGSETPATFLLDSDRGDGAAEMCGVHFRIQSVAPGRRAGEAIPLESYRITLLASTPPR